LQPAARPSIFEAGKSFVARDGMKTVCAFAVIATLAAGGARAADPPAAPSATPVNHLSLKVCNKQADARELTGPARAQFVKECHTGKTSGKGAGQH
jgi:hypothetical protein